MVCGKACAREETIARLTMRQMSIPMVLGLPGTGVLLMLALPASGATIVLCKLPLSSRVC